MHAWPLTTTAHLTVPTSLPPPPPPTHPPTRSKCRSRFLIGNTLFFLHVALLAGFLGGGAGKGSSTPLMVALLVVKGIYAQYLLAFRPFASTAALLVEIAPSLLEVLLFIFAFMQQLAVSMSPSPSVICIVLVYVEVVLVTLVELVRSVMLIAAIFSHKKAGSETRVERIDAERLPHRGNSGRRPSIP